MTNELYHHGVRGQKWYVRRWQNEDGSLTPAGRIHYGYGEKNLDPKVADPNSVKKILKSMSSTDLKMLNLDSPEDYYTENEAEYHFVKNIEINRFRLLIFKRTLVMKLINMHTVLTRKNMIE